jgi:hypothetical protein
MVKRMDRRKERLTDPTKREFLRTVGVSVPTLAVIAQPSGTAFRTSMPSRNDAVSEKFTPIDLSPYFNASPREFGPRERAKEIGGECARDGLIRVPTGRKALQGVPFWLGPEGLDGKSWIGLSTASK